MNACVTVLSRCSAQLMRYGSTTLQTAINLRGGGTLPFPNVEVANLEGWRRTTVQLDVPAAEREDRSELESWGLQKRSEANQRQR